jgi:hypothetical protein
MLVRLAGFLGALKQEAPGASPGDWGGVRFSFTPRDE